MEPIVIKRQPEVKSMVRVAHHILLTQPYVKILGVCVVIFTLVSFFGQPKSTEIPASESWVSYLTIVVIWAFIIFSMDRGIRKNIKNNPKNFEPQMLTLTSNSLTSEGQTYKVEYVWSTIFKIKETKSWFLIYINKNSALPIEKENLTDNEYNELKKLFASLNVKKNLLA